MGWASNWKVEFAPNGSGECIEDLWDDEEVDAMAERVSDEERDFYVECVNYSGGEAEVCIKYGYECSIASIARALWELYGCPMKITYIDETGDGSEIDMVEPDYYPSQFEYEYDDELEKMIQRVAEKEDVNLNYNKDCYSRESRYELLAKTMFKIHYP